jgi:hypothetical protein
MATVAGIYREALRLIGDHDIVDENEATPNRFVLDSAYANAAQYCMSLGWWRFAFATVTPSLTSTSLPGYTRQFAKPNDWLRTHSVQLVSGTQTYLTDWYEEGANIAVKYTAAIVLKYIQSDIASTSWPEVFAKVVAAYLAFETCERLTQSRSTKADIYKVFIERLDLCRTSESVPPPIRLAEHTIERQTKAILEEGMWKFGMKTVELSSAGGPPSIGYAYRFTKPADWLRSVHVFRQTGMCEIPLDFRDEGGFLHADHDPIVLRYLSTDAVSPVTGDWTELFTNAWNALLRLKDAEQNGANENEVQARLLSYRTALSEARIKDGLNERPKVHKPSAFTAARRGAWSGEQAR